MTTTTTHDTDRSTTTTTTTTHIPLPKRQTAPHDLIYLGNIGESLIIPDYSQTPHLSSSQQHKSDQTLRLPLLLRLLSGARKPHSSSLQSILRDAKRRRKGETGGGDGDDDDNKPSFSSGGDGGDESNEINEVVCRLEAVVTSNPAAEGFDVLSTYLAPAACRKLSKCHPLKRKYPHPPRLGQDYENSTGWDASQLSLCNSRGGPPSQTSKPKSKKRRTTRDDNDGSRDDAGGGGGGHHAGDHGDELNDDETETDDENDDDETMSGHRGSDAANRAALPRKRTKGGGAAAAVVVVPSQKRRLHDIAASDSQESAVDKLLHEVSSLVVASLAATAPSSVSGSRAASAAVVGGTISRGATDDDPALPPGASGGAAARQRRDGAGDDPTAAATTTGAFLPVTADAMLAKTSSSTGGSELASGEGSDLTAILAALLHHAPVLRHDHVANALCSAALPQTPAFIARLAANCPAASPSLIRGCIDAHLLASSPPHNSILSSSQNALRAIAALSPRESHFICSELQSRRIMPELFLDLMWENDTGAAVAILNGDLILASQRRRATTDEAEKTATSSNERRASTAIGPHRRRIRRRRRQKPPQSLHPWLAPQLRRNPRLATLSRKCLIRHLSSPPPKGWLALLSQTLSLLLYHVGIGAGSSDGNGSKGVVDAMTNLAAAVVSSSPNEGGRRRRAAEEQRQPWNEMALTACLVTCVRFSPIGGVDGSNGYMKGGGEAACETCLRVLLSSGGGRVFRARVAGCLFGNDAVGLRSCACETMGMEGEGEGEEEELEAWMNVCRWAGVTLGGELLREVMEVGVTKEAFLVDVRAVTERVRQFRRGDDGGGGEEREKWIDGIMKDLLTDEQKCQTVFHKNGVLDLIETVIDEMATRHGPKIPIILPLTIDNLSRKVQWRNHQQSSAITIDKRPQFILQLLYCFTFMDKIPQSPFIFDPRSLPLRVALAYTNTSSTTYHTHLLRHMSHHCPEISPSPSPPLTPPLPNLTTLSLPTILTLLTQTIQNSLSSSSDPSSSHAESLFLHASLSYPLPSIDTTAIRALLSTTTQSNSFVTHEALRRDPLVLLKLPLQVWRKRGLRRMLLAILKRLLSANEAITIQAAKKRRGAAKKSALTSARQLLAARDLTLLRCLLIFGSGSYVHSSSSLTTADDNNRRPIPTTTTPPPPPPTPCHVLIHAIRTLVSHRPGLVATLLRQGLLPDAGIDYIVSYVPEAWGDAVALGRVLNDSYLTASERLVVADAALRLSMAYGGRRPEGEEEEGCCNTSVSLASRALATLVASFYLVVGPVGVAVNVLCEGGGEDVTQRCRKSTFRMLNALQKMGGVMGGGARSVAGGMMRREAIAALTKIAGFCKSEGGQLSSSAPGSGGGVGGGGVGGGVIGGGGSLAAMRRKAVLKDVFDATVRAVNAMGGGA